MAFPVVEGSATTDSPPGSTHAVNLPTGIVAGEQLLLIGSFGNNAATGAIAGWTEVLDENVARGLFIAYRYADGTEGSTVTVTTSIDRDCGFIVYRISEAEGAPEIGTTATGTSSQPNPPSLAPSGGVKSYLWFAVVSKNDDDITGGPTDFSGLVTVNYLGTASLATAWRQLNTASQDPGSFSSSSSDAYRAQTIAISQKMPTTANELRSAGAGASTAGPNQDWANPGNITASDDNRASVSMAGNVGQTSDPLAATSFGFAIPTDADIQGIKLEIERCTGVSVPVDVEDAEVKLLKAGAAVGPNRAATGVDWPPDNSESIQSYGGERDLWETTWTPAEINASNFGAFVRARPPSNASETAQVDHMRITVYYEAPPVTEIAGSDTGAGTDEVALDADPGTRADAAAGTDASTDLANDFLQADSGLGTDTAVLDQVTEIVATDSGGGGDSTFELLQEDFAFLVAEEALGDDLAFVEVEVAASDTGTSLEEVVERDHFVEEAGLGSEALVEAFSDLEDFDSGVGAEQPLVLEADFIGRTDSGAGLDTTVQPTGAVPFIYTTPTEVPANMSATIREASPTAPDSRSAILRPQAGANVGQHVLLDVPLTVPIGVDALVLSAEVLLYKSAAWPAGSQVLTVTPLDENWSGETATWENAPAERAGEAISFTVAGTGSEGDEILLDISQMVQAAVAAANAGSQKWYGVKISTTSTTELPFYSAYSAPGLRPMLKAEWSIAPDQPSGLTPSLGLAVSEQKPELVAQFFDRDAGDTLSALEVIISTASDLSVVTYDSGKLSADSARFDLDDPPTGAPATPTLVLGTPYFWAMRVWDNHDRESALSSVAEFVVVAKSALALTAPTGDVTSPIPTFTWTFGGAQEDWELVVEKLLNGIWQDHHRVGRHGGPELSYKIPDDRRLSEGVEYRATLRVWDDVDRADMPGDRAFVEDSVEFSLLTVSV